MLAQGRTCAFFDDSATQRWVDVQTTTLPMPTSGVTLERSRHTAIPVVSSNRRSRWRKRRKPFRKGSTRSRRSSPSRTLPQAIEWYKKALGAEEKGRATGPDGKIIHAELRIGDSLIMLNDAMMGGKGPESDGRLTRVALGLCRGLRRALQPRRRRGRPGHRPAPWGRWRTSSGAIAAERSPIRTATRWTIATRKEDLSPQEMEQRQADWMKQFAAHS